MNTYFIIDNYLFMFLAVLFRIGGFFITVPYFSAVNIPSQIKILFSLAMSFIIIFYIPSVNFNGEFSVLYISFKEFLFGAGLGLGIKMIFSLIAGAGEIIGQQGGFAMARLYDPLKESQTNVIANYLNILLMFVFISVGGHLILLRIFLESYRIVPVDFSLKIFYGFEYFTKLFILVFSLAVRLSAPSIITVLLTYIALGIMTKIAPKMNIFSLSFSVNILISVIVLMLITGNTAKIMLLSLDKYLKDILMNF